MQNYNRQIIKYNRKTLKKTSKKERNTIIIGRENQYQKDVNFLQIDLKIPLHSIKIQQNFDIQLGSWF